MLDDSCRISLSTYLLIQPHRSRPCTTLVTLNNNIHIHPRLFQLPIRFPAWRSPGPCKVSCIFLRRVHPHIPGEPSDNYIRPILVWGIVNQQRHIIRHNQLMPIETGALIYIPFNPSIHSLNHHLHNFFPEHFCLSPCPVYLPLQWRTINPTNQERFQNHPNL